MYILVELPLHVKRASELVVCGLLPEVHKAANGFLIHSRGCHLASGLLKVLLLASLFLNVLSLQKPKCYLPWGGSLEF